MNKEVEEAKKELRRMLELSKLCFEKDTYFKEVYEKDLNTYTVILNYIQELEEYKGHYERMKKMFQDKFDRQEKEFNKMLDDYIPKQKIMDKIKELKTINFGTDLVTQSTANLTTICILQDLLKEE